MLAQFGTNASGILLSWTPAAGEITQVKESIPWVRCASGNDFPNKVPPTTHLPYYLCIFIFLTSFQVVPIDIANDAVTTADYKVYLQRKLRNKEKNYKSNEKM